MQCDGHDDCDDGSDEAECTQIERKFFFQV